MLWNQHTCMPPASQLKAAGVSWVLHVIRTRENITIAYYDMRKLFTLPQPVRSGREQFMAPGSRPQSRVLVEKDVPMQTRDGVTLHADV